MSAVALARPLPGVFWPDPETEAVGCVVLALGATDGGGAGWAAVVTATGRIEFVGSDHVDVLDESLRLMAEAGARDHAQRVAMVPLP